MHYIKSTYSSQISLDPTRKTAIIYSLDELNAYSIEINVGGKSYYLRDHNKLITYGNMKEAREAAIREKAQVAYLALTKTSEETDISTCHANHQDRYDYMLIPL